MTGIPDAEAIEAAWQKWRDTDDNEWHAHPISRSAFDAGVAAAAARVRAAQAQAWDEGFNDGAHYASADLSHATYRTPPPPNPYSEPGDEFQNPED